MNARLVQQQVLSSCPVGTGSVPRCPGLCAGYFLCWEQAQWMGAWILGLVVPLVARGPWVKRLPHLGPRAPAVELCWC